MPSSCDRYWTSRSRATSRSEYRRPRDLNLADGVKVIQSSYSILDGLGPLTINYLVGANYTTTIPITFDANTLATTEYDDVANGGGNAAGDVTSPGLGAVAQLVFNFRSFSTTPAKNTYQYPRPFRMSNSSVVSDLGTTTSINATNISGNTTTGITTTTGTRTWPN